MSRLPGVLWCAGALRNVYYARPLCCLGKTGRRRQPLLGLIRVFEAGAIRARAGPKEESLAGHDHASSSLREHGRDTRHPAALASGGSNADQNKRRGSGRHRAAVRAVAGCLSDASRTLAVIEPASQHGGLPNLAKP